MIKDLDAGVDGANIIILFDFPNPDVRRTGNMLGGRSGYALHQLLNQSNIPVNNEQSRLIVTFHNTAVVQVVNDRYVILNSGGWLTPTTKRRMNQASDQFNLNFKVFQKDYQWLCETTKPNGKKNIFCFQQNRLSLPIAH